MSLLRIPSCSLLGFSWVLSASLVACNGADVHVHAGESIQAAIDQMPKGRDSWVVEIHPGVYRESLDVSRAGVELRGVVLGPKPEDRPILDGALAGDKRLKDAIVVSGAHFTASGLYLRTYAGNGITAQKTHHFTLRDVIADDAGKYGFYPVESEDILLENCVATRISDAGVYVGQSKRAKVIGCKAYGNVAGIEIENTIDALVEDNEAWDNAAGILVFVLPNAPAKKGEDCTVRNNYVHDNNHANFGDPTAVVAQVPPGLGMLIMAADNTLVTKNRIEGNGSVGVAIIGLDVLTKEMDPAIERKSDDTRLIDNTYKNNGKSPSEKFKQVVMEPTLSKGGDLAWDGSGTGNCQAEPAIASLTSYLLPLDTCAPSQTGR